MAIAGIGTIGYPDVYEPGIFEQKAVSDDVIETEDYQKVIQEYKEKLFVRIKNGDTESAYQIGSQSLTEKEWDELLEKFDLAESAFSKNVREKLTKRKETQKDAADITEGLQKAGAATAVQEPSKAETAVQDSQKAETATAVQEPSKAEAAAQDPQKAEATAQGVQKTESISDVQMDMLISDTIQARFPLQEVDEEGNPKEDLYLIAIDKKGIRCSKAGSSEYEWQIIFTDESQYQKAVEFMDWADDRMDNFLFSAHENFWEDYLNGNMDVDAFQKFLEGTNNGIPDYSYTIGDSMYIDREKAQWAKYMNRPYLFASLSGEELLPSVDMELEKNKIMYGKTFEQLLKENYTGWDTMTFGFAGEAKEYSFYEFVEEWQNRYAMEVL